MKTGMPATPRPLLFLLYVFFPLVLPPVLHAQTPSELRQFLEGLDAGAPARYDGARLHQPQLVSDFYRNNQHQPVWLAEGQATKNLNQLVSAVESSAAHGLLPQVYHQGLLSDTDAAPLARELLATDAFLTQALHRQNGVIDPATIDPDWFLKRDTIDPVELLQKALADGRITESLNQLWPRHSEYQALLNKRAELSQLPEAETATVTGGPALKPGMNDPRIVQLKTRLLGPGDYSPVYDKPLQEAVTAFQAAAGLDADAVVGTATLERMNATHFSWIDKIDANLERWRWLPDTLPPTYLRVNIAAFTLRAIRDGQDDYRMNVIVGKPYRKTPVFAEPMRYFVYNPYWNVPASIATKDKLPLLKKDAGQLESLGYEARASDATDFVGVSQIDWQPVTSRTFNYVLRQKPGSTNALGRIKFMLPNTHSVYLHDTPDHSLFQKQERGFSSGCVRLSDPLGLARWVLAYDGQPATPETIQQIIDSRETQTVNLRKPLPVYIVYLTAFVDDDSHVVFRRDLYQRDQAIVDLLRQVN